MSMRLGGFLGIPLLSAIAPFITLPVVARIAGEAGWGDISAAQAIGTLGSIAVTFGWGIYGPPAVATTTDVATRQRYYLDSLVVRAITAAIVLPAVLVITWAVIGTGFVRDSLFLAGSLTLLGLLPSWYCIGVGEPILMARYDVLPRLAAALVSLPIMLWTQSIWPYPVLTTLALVVPLTLFSRRILRGYRRPAGGGRPLWARFRQTAATAGIDAAGNAYGSTPVPISTATLPVADASSFGSADRLYRIGLGIVVAALGNAFQGWVLAPDAVDRRRRQHLAIAAHAVTGLVGLVFLATLGPWATGVFLGAEVAAERWPSVWFGVAFLFISLSTPLIRNLLIPAGRGKFVLLATIISSVAGLVLMGVGAARQDAAFIAFGMAASEIVLVAVLAAPALRLRPAPPATAGRSAS
ncbi:polysaccharide biosynthesis protein [Xylanimonas cellulosilytica DSM 15894]|uniref:Polysaccharide biosynthesis protein n=1 Tax=Xylanimonas cellulosilytica (strain DSM 15894 / JCM 12276 / CECT 5975 / KCTC 9989 / LMG 20990 / NBRC 107835 / XIL07) TaxID=446471 RepID=D1BX11_XYLCX|nr:polysaccharide biosynthesis protein [Xylanimonas cellulosilytica]ACZ31579.1 polysaccharide biosynthesis protein [Xylanimonas cellulosilytica DSM 15894]